MFNTRQQASFDWAGALALNAEALRGIVATLFAMLGDVTTERLPEQLYRAVLRVLHPAESAVRRLIVIAARGLVVKPVPSRPIPKAIVSTGEQSRPTFKLFDPRKRLTTAPERVPRIHIFSHDPTVAAIFAARARSNPIPQPDDGRFNCQQIVRRLQALKSALDNLPHQAKRLVRARLRRDKIPRLKFKSPLRPGPPPGHRKIKVHEIDEILAECHGLARDALREDTS